MITKRNAEQLWTNLHDNLLAAQDNITAIIRQRAWEPLGQFAIEHAHIVDAVEDHNDEGADDE